METNLKYPLEIGIKRLILNFHIIKKSIFILSNDSLTKYSFDETNQLLIDCSSFIPFVNKKLKKIKRASLSSNTNDIIIETNCHIFIVDQIVGQLKKHIERSNTPINTTIIFNNFVTYFEKHLI